MKYLYDLFKAFIVCAIVNAVFTYYSASSAFLKQAASGEKDMSRFELFIHFSETTDDFWPRVIENWFFTFSLSFICCLGLLLWLRAATHNKSFSNGRA